MCSCAHECRKMDFKASGPGRQIHMNESQAEEQFVDSFCTPMLGCRSIVTTRNASCKAMKWTGLPLNLVGDRMFLCMQWTVLLCHVVIYWEGSDDVRPKSTTKMKGVLTGLAFRYSFLRDLESGTFLSVPHYSLPPASALKYTDSVPTGLDCEKQVWLH